MAQRVKIDGLRDLEKALAQLPKATGKGVLRRVGKKELQPVADAAAALAPEAEGTLKGSIAVSTKLSKRQGKLHRKMFRDMQSVLSPVSSHKHARFSVTFSPHFP